MKIVLLLVAVAVGAAVPSFQSAPGEEPEVWSGPATLDELVTELYAGVSGDAGEPRDWDRMAALFHPTWGRLGPIGKSRDGKAPKWRTRVLTPDDYRQMTEPVFAEEAFYESEVHREVEQFGPLAQVFSTYESRHSAAGEPFQRGVNAITAYDDGERWWVLSLAWFGEDDEHPLPSAYLPPR
jgi:hypothetical protein